MHDTGPLHITWLMRVHRRPWLCCTRCSAKVLLPDPGRPTMMSMRGEAVADGFAITTFGWVSRATLSTRASTLVRCVARCGEQMGWVWVMSGDMGRLRDVCACEVVSLVMVSWYEVSVQSKQMLSPGWSTARWPVCYCCLPWRVLIVEDCMCTLVQEHALGGGVAGVVLEDDECWVILGNADHLNAPVWTQCCCALLPGAGKEWCGRCSSTLCAIPGHKRGGDWLLVMGTTKMHRLMRL